MAQDCGDDPRVRDRGDPLHAALAARAFEDVPFEDATHEVRPGQAAGTWQGRWGSGLRCGRLRCGRLRCGRLRCGRLRCGRGRSGAGGLSRSFGLLSWLDDGLPLVSLFSAVLDSMLPALVVWFLVVIASPS